ncbi:transposase [Geobacillus stearothermophilus]|uniref:transposase n=1 Tax=Geobacillus stearothermophilus TaxID=1422 RepID=UPI00399C4F2C
MGSSLRNCFNDINRANKHWYWHSWKWWYTGCLPEKITLITEELCGTSFSKSTVSSLCKGLDPIIQDWNHRSLHEHVYLFILVDAIYTKVREDGRVRCSLQN